MNGYEPRTPRAALGLTAVAMAVITMAAMVVLPAKLDGVGAGQYTEATANGATKVATKEPVSGGQTLIAQARAIAMRTFAKNKP